MLSRGLARLGHNGPPYCCLYHSRGRQHVGFTSTPLRLTVPAWPFGLDTELNSRSPSSRPYTSPTSSRAASESAAQETEPTTDEDTEPRAPTLPDVRERLAKLDKLQKRAHEAEPPKIDVSFAFSATAHESHEEPGVMRIAKRGVVLHPPEFRRPRRVVIKAYREKMPQEAIRQVQHMSIEQPPSGQGTASFWDAALDEGVWEEEDTINDEQAADEEEGAYDDEAVQTSSHTHKERPLTPVTILLNLLAAMRSPFVKADSPRTQRILQAAASVSPERLPGLVTRLLLLEMEFGVRLTDADLDLNRTHRSPDSLDTPWRASLIRLCETCARKGYKPSDVLSWVSILREANVDDAVSRFTEPGQHHPIFLLNYLLRPSAQYAHRESLKKVVEYMSRWYASEEVFSSPSDAKLGWGQEDARLNAYRSLIWEAGLFVPIRRLAFHCARAWPELVPAVAHVAAGIVKVVIPRVAAPHEVSPMQNRAWNKFLQSLAEASDRMGCEYMEHIWAAQKVLLAISSSDTPLAPTKRTFRAVRIVLLGLKKTPEERDAATTLSSEWPPHRVDRSGIDQQRDVADDFTRPIKAGMAMAEAGWVRDAEDDVIDTLAGRDPDGRPTIQTRANLQGLLRKPAGALGPHAQWASAIRATRNAHEAWAVFKQGRDKHKPDHRVYCELLLKVAAPTAVSDSYQAGDGRPAVDVRIPNLSDYEKIRRQPPTPLDVKRMIAIDRVEPEGHLLTVLLQTAESVDEAQSLLARNLDQDVTDILVHSTGNMLDVFERIPFGPFYQYLAQLLQRPSGNRRRQRRSMAVTQRIPRAMHLICEYTEANRHHARRFVSLRPLWRLVMMRWSQARGVWLPDRHEPVPPFQLFFQRLRAMQLAKDAVGLDSIFYYSCRAVCYSLAEYLGVMPGSWGRQHGAAVVDPVVLFCKPSDAASQTLPWDDLVEAMDGMSLKTEEDIDRLEESYLNGDISPLHVIAATARQLAVDASVMRSPVTTSPAAAAGLPLPERYHTLQGHEAYMYMQTLALLGDFGRMVGLLEWCADRWEEGPEHLEAREMVHFRRTFSVFRVMERNMDPASCGRLEAVVDRLRRSRGWPRNDEVLSLLENGSFWSWMEGRLGQLRPGRYVFDEAKI